MLKTGIIKNLFSNEDFTYLQNHFKQQIETLELLYDDHGRKMIHSNHDPILNKYAKKILPKVRDFFEDQTIMPTYSICAEYSYPIIDLHKHKDLNACQYTVHMSLYHTSQYPLWIEGKQYPLRDNEAIFYCSEEQEHWRETRINNRDKIGIIFFHFVDKNHWWFSKGPEYVEVIREKARANK